MFCTKCGSALGNGGAFCPMCGAPLSTTSVATESEPVFELISPCETPTVALSDENDDDLETVRYGRKRAVTGFILSASSSLVLLIEMLLSGGLGDLIFLLFLAPIAMSVVSIVFSIKSIKAFIEMASSNRKRPVATLVFGIISLPFAGECLLIYGFFFLWFIAFL